MNRLTIPLLLTITSCHIQAEEKSEQVRWLSWPVTGEPYQSIDPGIFMPSANERFQAITQKDVIIGLRSDGVVVWKYVDESKNKSSNNSEITNKQTENH